MRSSRASLSRVWIGPLYLGTAMGFIVLAQGQAAGQSSAPAQDWNVLSQPRAGVPADWSHYHVFFSSPGTSEQAQRNGTYDRWVKIANDPRFLMQQRRRIGAGPVLPTLPQPRVDREPACSPDGLGQDDAFGEDATPMAEDVFPNGVLPRGLARALVPPSAQQTEAPRGTRERGPCRGEAANENRFQKDWSVTEGNNGTTGLGNYPATFTSNSASCSNDFAVYNTGLAGSSSQASVIAFNQLYGGCTTRPSAYWAYNTGGTIATSVALSLDGSQVAFVQSGSGGVASLVVLKWAAGGTLTGPTSLTSNSSYPNCTAPCMISVTFSGSPTDTYSSPFIAYGSGAIYVGDDAGNLHKFTNIFTSSTPVEAGSPWPVTINISTDAALASPVYDSVSGNIFVGDYLANVESSCQPGISSTTGQCGYVYSVSSSSGAVTQSAQLDYNLGIYDGPVVDPSAGEVYAFVGADNSTACSSGPCAAVVQFPVNFSANASGAKATVGAGYEFLMSGNFDNQYFTSSSPSSPTGHLYVVGGTGPQNNTLYAITITNNVMGSATAGPTVAANYTNGYYAGGLPVSEFCNNGNSPCTSSQGTDYVFVGVLSYGSSFSTNPCTGQSLSVGCVMGFTLPASGVISSAATPNGTLPEAGGTSGIVVDNGASGASNIYFSTLLNQSCTGGTGGCAVSATQAGLQ